MKNKPDIQKLCSFSREGNALFTKTKSPVALYISKIMELRSGGWLQRKIRLHCLKRTACFYKLCILALLQIVGFCITDVKTSIVSELWNGINLNVWSHNQTYVAQGLHLNKEGGSSFLLERQNDVHHLQRT